MATPVLMPRQGQSVESCILVEWLVEPGEAVEAGQNLANIETDKAVFELESPEAGTVLELFFEAGDDIPVLTTIAALGEPGEDVSALRPGAEAPEAPEASAAEPDAAEEPVAPPGDPAPAGPKAVSSAGVSPRARERAARSGVQTANLAGTGPGGRVLERDVIAAAPAAGAGASEAVEEPMRGVRKLIAERMMVSLGTAAQYTLTRRFDARALLARRAAVKQAMQKDGGPDISINDMLLYAVSRVLLQHPALNAHCLEDRILRFPGVNIGIAVDTPRGLMVPVVSGVDGMTLEAISAAAQPAVEACREGKAQPDLFQGGTFTVSNLGALGVEAFTPVLNTPEVAILGVGCITPAPRTGEGGSIEIVPSMTLSLTADHRAVDGAPAARFLADLCLALEQFDTDPA